MDLESLRNQIEFWVPPYLFNGVYIDYPYLPPLVALFGLLAFILLYHRHPGLREIRMRREREKEIVADLIVDVFENATHDRKLSDKSKNYWYGQFVRKHGLKNLKPRNIKTKGRSWVMYNIYLSIASRLSNAKTIPGPAPIAEVQPRATSERVLNFRRLKG